MHPPPLASCPAQRASEPVPWPFQAYQDVCSLSGANTASRNQEAGARARYSATSREFFSVFLNVKLDVEKGHEPLPLPPTTGYCF